jgi:hypothetical protein
MLSADIGYWRPDSGSPIANFDTVSFGHCRRSANFPRHAKQKPEHSDCIAVGARLDTGADKTVMLKALEAAKPKPGLERTATQ